MDLRFSSARGVTVKDANARAISLSTELKRCGLVFDEDYRWFLQPIEERGRVDVFFEFKDENAAIFGKMLSEEDHG